MHANHLTKVLPFLSEAALSTLSSCFEYVRQLPNISMYLPHHQASIDTLLQSAGMISKRLEHEATKED